MTSIPSKPAESFTNLAGIKPAIYCLGRNLCLTSSRTVIDQYHRYLNPAAIGTGKKIFGDTVQKTGLKLISAPGFDGGAVALVYAFPR